MLLMVVTPQGSEMQKIIDPHLHFFDLNKGNYAWLKSSNPPFWPDKSLINKDVMPVDLVINNNELLLIGAVHIEAGFNNEMSQNELRWLEREVYPIETRYVFKSISYIDLKKPSVDFEKQFEFMMIYPTFKGIRCIIDDDESFYGCMECVIENLKILECAGILLEMQLSFCDILLTRFLLEAMSKVPKLKLVVNHSGLPPLAFNASIKDRIDPSNENDKTFINEFHTWEKNLALFAELPNCFIKCSGFEMQNREYTKRDVIEIIKRVHAHFGTNKMMLASNFPLTLFTRSYSEYWTLLHECTKEAQLDCERLMHRNAKELYCF